MALEEWRECWCCGELLYWDAEAVPPQWVHPEGATDGPN